ncbi:MAG: pyrB [Candidatus Saccharibacteria bacterium]|nr:pyrB [Candidatus Saccharibacteria bacterium]
MAATIETAPEQPCLETRPRINGEFEGKNLLSIDQFAREDVETVLELAGSMEAAREAFRADRTNKIPQILSGFVLKAVMFEDSSRTSDSYMSAAAYLGAIPIQPNIATSSKNKGESDIETAFCFAENADGLLVRHKEAGFMDALVQRIDTPFTSGGNPGDHVTQTLKDFYTMQKLYGQIDGSHVVLAGYMAKYRASISLLKGLVLFNDIDVTIVAPESGHMPAEVIEQARQMGVRVHEATDLRPLLKQPGFFYIGRPPLEYAETAREKEAILAEYEEIGCRISHETMKSAHRQAIIAHPLPHNGEISDDFYTDPRAIYEQQEKNGVPVHMAIQALQFNQSELQRKNPFLSATARLK